MLQAMGPNTEPIYEVFLVSFVYFLYLFHKVEKTKYLVYSSILLLIMTLTRPISILYPIFFSLITLIGKRGLFKKRLAHIGLMLLIFAIGIGPWMVRGYKITGEVIPLVSYKSITYFENKADHKIADRSFKARGFVGRLKEEIQNPSLFLKKSVMRLIRFWYYGHSTPVRTVNAALQFPLLAVAIIGIWVARKKGILILPVLSTVCYFWMAYGATHAISRYSFPMIALLCPFVALGLNKIWEISKGRMVLREPHPGPLS